MKHSRFLARAVLIAQAIVAVVIVAGADGLRLGLVAVGAAGMLCVTRARGSKAVAVSLLTIVAGVAIAAPQPVWREPRETRAQMSHLDPPPIVESGALLTDQSDIRATGCGVRPLEGWSAGRVSRW